MILETEQHWYSFGFCAACVFGGNNLALADLDNDGLMEMITGGLSYCLYAEGDGRNVSAPILVWSWNGEEFTPKAACTWTGYASCVYAGDIEGDGKPEVIAAGGIFNEAAFTPIIRIWSLEDRSLKLKVEYAGEFATSIAVGDLDGDGAREIVAVGGSLNANLSAPSKIMIFQPADGTLKLRAVMLYLSEEQGSFRSLSLGDLDADGAAEIIVAGYCGKVEDSSGYLSLWRFDGTVISLIDEVKWQTVEDAYTVDVSGNPMGNTMVSDLQVADVDDDGMEEIVSCGFTYNGFKAQGQLRIWNLTAGSLNLEGSIEWTSLDITEATSTAISDIDGDGITEILTSGYTAGYGSWSPDAENKSRAELRIWHWNGNKAELEHVETWLVGEAVSAWNVGAGDVDADSVAEIVTVGCMKIGGLCDPDLRVWTFNSSSGSRSESFLPDWTVYAASAIIALVVLTTLYTRIKREKGVGEDS
ncbi:VCBS repeat-containing protein [Candidatus Bathyarchaeota archaeon]|nr:VCBS repeat-containing protein [Candidatus Bathyarchaeota archaeon]